MSKPSVAKRPLPISPLAVIARVLVPVLVAMLSACAGQTTLQSGEGERWSFSGKLGIWAEDINESARIQWLNCGDRYEIRLAGPMGVGAMYIRGDNDGVVLSRSGKEDIEADTPEDLLAYAGWDLPISSLPYWLRQRPVPDYRFSEKRDPDGRLQQLLQLGWTVDYLRFAAAEEGAAMQANLVEIHDQSLRAKFIIRDWDLAPQACL